MRGSFVGIVKAVADDNIAGVTGGKVINVTDEAIGKTIFYPANHGFDRAVARRTLQLVTSDHSFMYGNDLPSRDIAHYLSLR